jgi:WD40 repeat protein/serine/threonine protein kinase
MPPEASLPVSFSETLTGRTLGDFVVRERFGTGGFGDIYRAEQPLLGREAVIKTLRPAPNRSSNDVQRFLREARIASKLDHPCAAHVYAFGAEPDGVLWIAMELVRGTPLNRLLETTGPLPLARMVPLFDKICEVAHSAHEQGIVHRDLKPANVMVLSRSGRLWPKLLDFGIARLEDAPDPLDEPLPNENRAALDRTSPVTLTGVTADDLSRSESASLTQRGIMVGTPHYMAPEQWVDASKAGPKTDIYSLGVLAFQCLTGRLPFTGATPRAVAKAHASPDRPRLGREHPEALNPVLAKAMAIDPEARFTNALELATAFRAASGVADDDAPIALLDEEIRAEVQAEAPQPIADTVSVLEGARTPEQALAAVRTILRVAIRYVGLCTIAARARVGPSLAAQGPRVRDLLRTLRQDTLDDGQWIDLARELCAPFAGSRDAYPLPELVTFFFPSTDGESGAPVQGLRELLAVVEGMSREAPRSDLLGRLLPSLGKLLRGLLFLGHYPLVVGAGEDAEVWMGVSGRPARGRRGITGTHLKENEPALLNADGTLALSLFPMAQAMAPAPGHALQMFLLDGNGRHGARLLSLPLGLERQEPTVWSWFEERLGITADAGKSGGPSEHAPFQGLASFGPGDAANFFGRELEAQEFANRLRLHSFLAIVGPSGAGKSSFVQAGVIPLLASECRPLVVRPGSSPMRALREQLARAGVPVRADDPPDAIERALLEEGRTKARLLLVVDQFEELITLCLDADERVTYAQLLLDLVSRAGVKVVITLRDDFLLRVQQLAPMRRQLAPSIQLLGTPVKDDLMRILIEPLKHVGFAFEDEQLPHQMVDEVADQQGALALLSFTASKLWDLRDRHFRRLTRGAYQSLGGVGGALANHAEATLAQMGSEEQRLVREVFRALVTAEGTRAVLSRRELGEILGAGATTEAVLERLIQARLLVASEGGRGEDRIEVVHETLLRSWPRLVAWQREDAENVRLRDLLRAAARQWAERGRPKGVLWRDEALAEFRIWRKRYPGALTAVERDFAEASLREETRGRRMRRGVLVGILVALVSGILVLIRANQRAETSEQIAVQRLAQSHAEQGRSLLLSGRPIDALAYLTKAVEEGLWNSGIRYLLPRAAAALDSQRVVVRSPGAVNWVALSPDGQLAATASYGSVVQVWRLATGQQVWELTGHTGPVKRVAFSPDGRQLVSVSTDGTARFWDVATGAEAGKLALGGFGLWAAYSADGKKLVTGGATNVQIWNAATHVRLGELKTEDWVGVAIINGTGTRIVSAPGEYALSSPIRYADLIDADSGKPVARLGGHTAGVSSVAFSPDGGRVATASIDSTIRLWDSRTGSLISTLVGHEGAVNSVAWSADGTQVITGGNDGSARIWSAAHATPILALRGHEGAVLKVAFLGDGTRAVTAGDDGSIRVWDALTGNVRIVLRGHSQRVTALATMRDGTGVVSGSSDGTARVWDATGTTSTVVATPLAAMRINELFDLFTAPSANGVWTTWDLDAGKAKRVYKPMPQVGLYPGWSPKGDRLVTVGSDAVSKGLEVWDADAARVLLRVPSESPPTMSCWSWDGSRFGVVRNDGSFVLYDATTGQPVRSFHQAGVGSNCTFSPDGRTLATTSTDTVATLWDLETGQARLTLRGHLAPLYGIRFNRRGDRLMSFSQDETAILWDAATGRILNRFKGHRAVVTAIGFAPKHGLVLTSSNDGTVKIWEDTEGGALLETIPVGANATGAVFSPNEEWLYISTPKALARWRLPYEERSPSETLAALKCRLPVRLNDEGVLVQADPCPPR